jgi:hypothetical protein
MERFRCYYCQDHTENECSAIISHLAKEHDTLCLKNRESELHEETGRIGYRTKCYETVIPQDGEIFVTEDEKVGIYRGDKAKKKKLNTPVKSLNVRKHQLHPPSTRDDSMDIPLSRFSEDNDDEQFYEEDKTEES